MKKTINLGKIDYLNNGKKNCEVVIKIELIEKEEGLVLSIIGHIYNHIKTNSYAGGQCYDTISKFFPHNKKVQRIVEIWERYHLNDLRAGTPLQEKIIREWKEKGNKYDYTKVCEMLMEKGVYIDNNYKYGSKWLYEEIPQNIIEEIKSC